MDPGPTTPGTPTGAKRVPASREPHARRGRQAVVSGVAVLRCRRWDHLHDRRRTLVIDRDTARHGPRGLRCPGPTRAEPTRPRVQRLFSTLAGRRTREMSMAEELQLTSAVTKPGLATVIVGRTVTPRVDPSDFRKPTWTPPGDPPSPLRLRPWSRERSQAGPSPTPSASPLGRPPPQWSRGSPTRRHSKSRSPEGVSTSLFQHPSERTSPQNRKCDQVLTATPAPPRRDDRRARVRELDAAEPPRSML